MKQPNSLLLYHQRRFICTVIGNVYNGSKFRLTPSVWPEKAHDSPDIRDVNIFQSQKTAFFEQNWQSFAWPFYQKSRQNLLYISKNYF